MLLRITLLNVKQLAEYPKLLLLSADGVDRPWVRVPCPRTRGVVLLLGSDSTSLGGLVTKGSRSL
jgi:hypothetical protein